MTVVETIFHKLEINGQPEDRECEIVKNQTSHLLLINPIVKKDAKFRIEWVWVINDPDNVTFLTFSGLLWKE